MNSDEDIKIEDNHLPDIDDEYLNELDEEERKAELEGENLFDEGWEKDYDDLNEENEYDPEQLDDTEYPAMSIQERREAEAKMQKIDISKHIPFLQGIESSEDHIIIKPNDTSMDESRIDVDSDDSMDSDIDEDIRLEDPKGPIREWIVQSAVRKKIAEYFQEFLNNFKLRPDAKPFYTEKIRKMASENKQSLEVSYAHLNIHEQILSVYLGDEPAEMLNIFNEVAKQVTLKHFRDYESVHKDIYVRISDLPECVSIRDLRQIHLNQLIKVRGVVTRRTQVYPQLKLIKFDCQKCGNLIGPIVLNTRGNTIPKPGSCPSCQSKGPFTINQHYTIYRNYQKISLQETPGSVPAGRIPRSKDVILLEDLIDIARPGEEIEVTGIYRHNYDAFLNTRQGFPVFATVIEANHISKRNDDTMSNTLTKEDKEKIRELGKNPNIQEMIIQSIAPSIFGHRNIKLALALALFGGQPKNVDGKHRIRGDINVLLVGDPGTAKSQFLKYIEKTATRAVYTTGKGSTAVGLTAAVQKDPLTREWTLEGGALVLADNGVCMIDEFDKMNDQDRTSIHEAMEQQTISISKAGIVTTLQARCSIIAAANPIKGRYDPTRTFKQNVDLSDPILSRFDVLCVVKDTVDADLDEQLATFVVNSHAMSHPNSNAKKQKIESVIPQDLLKKYILYAKKHYHPKLHNLDHDKITKFYVELRKESYVGGGIPITVRHMESCVRLAEACARMHLRDYVREDDVNTAISVVLESFISTQKYSIAQSMRRKFSKYLTTDHFQLLLHLLQSTYKELEDAIPLDEFEARAKKMGIYSVQKFIQSKLFKDAGFKLDNNEIIKI